MKLLDLDSPLWKAYRGAYGSVRKEVGILMGEPAGPQDQLRRLREKAEDDEHLAFDNLCESLSHQMTFYDAMYVTLPYIVNFLGKKAGDYEWKRLIFSEIGQCLAADAFQEGTPGATAEILESYQEAKTILAEQAERFLKDHRKQLRKEGVFERRWLCAGLYGLLGDHREAYAIIMNAWGTCYVQCGHCGWLDEELELFDTRQRRKLRPLRPWQKQPDSFRRFRAILHRMGDWEGEELLADYYGVYTCPKCGKRQPVMEGLIRAFDPSYQPPETEPAPQKNTVKESASQFFQRFSSPKAPAPEPEPPAQPEEEPSAPALEAEPSRPDETPKEDSAQPDVLDDNAITRAMDLCREEYPSITALVERGERKEAAEWCARYLETAPDWRLYALRAFCCKALQNYPELDRCLSAALDLDPDNILILRARCPAVATANRYRRQIQDLSRLLELDPEHQSRYLVNRAYRRHWTGDQRGAVQDLRDALAAEPEIWSRSKDFRGLWTQCGLPEGEARYYQP